MANPITTSLPAYLDEEGVKQELIRKTVLGSPSIGLFAKQLDNKSTKALGFIENSLKWQANTGCGWNDSGTTTVSERILTVGNIKVNTSYCDKTMQNNILQYAFTTSTIGKDEPFGLEKAIIDSIMEDQSAALETAVWQSKLTGGVGNLAFFDGILAILTAGVASTINIAYTAAGTSATAISDAIDETFLAIPEALVDKADTVIFVDSALYRKYVVELRKANLYHTDPSTDTNEIMYPGSNVRVISIPGLNGQNKIIAGRLSNFVYGTDLVSDQEDFSFNYAFEAQEWRLIAKWVMGTQVGLLGEVVVTSVTLT